LPITHLHHKNPTNLAIKQLNNTLFNIGLTYYKTGKKQQGLVYLQSAKKIAQEIDNFELNQALDDLPFDV
jgi:DNA-binding transcriptional regulator WhiA